MAFLEQLGVILCEQKTPGPAHGRANIVSPMVPETTKINVHVSFDPQPLDGATFIKRYIMTSDFYVNVRHKMRLLVNPELDDDGDLMFDDLTISACSHVHLSAHECNVCKLPHIAKSLYDTVMAAKAAGSKKKQFRIEQGVLFVLANQGVWLKVAEDFPLQNGFY
jgi:hypothetical protein